ncbi:unnamed protein product, partial [Ectocarpus sp. 12 AP-2014]
HHEAQQGSGCQRRRVCLSRPEATPPVSRRRGRQGTEPGPDILGTATCRVETKAAEAGGVSGRQGVCDERAPGGSGQGRKAEVESGFREECRRVQLRASRLDEDRRG